MKIRFLPPALAVLIVACAPSLARRHYATNINGVEIPIETIGGLSCSGLSLPSTPTQAEIDAACALLSPQKARELKVWYKHHANILNAQVHTLRRQVFSLHTCPFLAYAPTRAKFDAGTMTPQAWAEWLHDFYGYKHDEQKAKDKCDCEAELKK